MNESQLWKSIRPQLREFGVYAERITDRTRSGVGDVVYVQIETGVTGWVELKYCPNYPKRSARGFLAYVGLKQEQVLWLNNWAVNGGVAGVLVRVNSHWHYWRMDGTVTMSLSMLQWTIEEAVESATRSWTRGVDWDELTQMLVLPTNQIS